MQPQHTKLIERGKRSEACNTAKLAHWNDAVQASDDGDRLLLIDADAFILRPLDPVWEKEFDLAYTVRPTRFPLNGGVVFLRVSPAVRAFCQAWATENMRLLHDNADQRQPWRAEYGGINQASFAHMLRTDHQLTVETLPCREWNCEDTTWSDFDPAITRIVHVKGALRMACVQSQPILPGLAEIAAHWKACDHAVRSARVPA